MEDYIKTTDSIIEEDNSKELIQSTNYEANTSNLVADENPQTQLDDTSPDNDSHAFQEQLTHDFHYLQTEMQSLRTDFDTKIKYDVSKEKLIDTLHKELQTYREGLHFKILRPLVMDLIAMYDDLGKISDNYGTEKTEEQSQIVQNLQSFQDTIEEILYRSGVEAFHLDEPTFVPNKQRILKVIDTDNVELDKHIAQHVRKGFFYYDKLLRPELVHTYKFTASLIATQERSS